MTDIISVQRKVADRRFVRDLLMNRYIRGMNFSSNISNVTS